jgi:hypothetical protein
MKPAIFIGMRSNSTERPIKHMHRFRRGDLRIVYEIDEQEIAGIKTGVKI